MLSPVIDPEAPTTLAARGRRQLPMFLRNKKAFAGAVIIGFFVLVSLLGPWLAPYSPSAQSTAPGSSVAAPSFAHLLGTDQLGRDVLSQVLVGTRTTMLIGIITGVVATILAVLIGVGAGYLGDKWDELLSLLSNVFLVFPALPFLIVVLGAFPSTGDVPIVIMLSVLGWPWGARVIRAQTLSIRNKDFVAAAQETGERSWHIILHDIVPNQISLIAATFVGAVLYAIGTSVGLNFLGIGGTSTWSLGTILYWAENGNALELGAWWWFAVPGVLIALIGMGLVLINFGLDELGNPRLRDGSRVGRVRGKLWTPSDPTLVEREGDGVRHHRLSLRSRGSGAGDDHNGIPVASSLITVAPTRNGDSSPAGHAGPLLEIRDLSIVYRSGGRELRAVNNINLSVERGEIVGLAGESGSGKSTLAYGACRLLRPPAVITSGSVIYSGERYQGGERDLLRMDACQLEQLRWREISIVFQSAMNALNPVLRIEDQLLDPIQRHLALSNDEAHDRVYEVMELVDIPRNRLKSYPHELSGGMRQRIMIAMALTVDPQLIIMDEPTTALDVVVQRDILVQIKELKERLNFSVIFITHDLSLLVELADRLAIMYAGSLMEIGDTTDLAEHTAHPYTQGLLHSFPPLHGPRKSLLGIPGSPPDLYEPVVGCPFAPRCGYRDELCEHVDVRLHPLKDGSSGMQLSACPFTDRMRSVATMDGSALAATDRGGLQDA
ncbi:MAG: dipeptide/oligopeptide/nickel ABC transporter permease/ATP-binding protein [Ferrimicrobium sp.]|uniref:dipeptide/oligopeptide/nickel ABC transporter permease/ATP-binding protein n=1 Tax=Ferrimicrobium sp. TaxID=2926050 RepID=UPI00262839A6|nr:dipeptide/oligopeptide/nickel ABC transporter permease/ATP-binding protein [Ferrimicrobium sp.]